MVEDDVWDVRQHFVLGWNGVQGARAWIPNSVRNSNKFLFGMTAFYVIPDKNIMLPKCESGIHAPYALAL